MRAIFLAGLLAVSAVSAHAEMPNYDVKAQCAKLASLGGSTSESVRETCYQVEQDAYNHVKPIWDSLPANLRIQCDKLASLGGPGSFSVLETCLQIESDAAKQNDGFQFKR